MVLMDLNSLRGRELGIDLESGTNAVISEHEGSRDNGSSVGQAKKLLNRAWSGFVRSDGSMKVEEAVSSGNNFSNPVEGPLENGEDLVGKRFGGEENVSLLEKKKVGAEKQKKKGCKKPPKPPRPPRSPSLDAADQKMVREISELAMLKRARIERMKALKKMKNAKSASSNSNLCALVITIVFCFVIIWQGVFSRDGSSVSFQGSPETSVGTRDGLISVQFYKNVSTNRGSRSASPNNVEQVSGLDDRGGAGRVTG